MSASRTDKFELNLEQHSSVCSTVTHKEPSTKKKELSSSDLHKHIFGFSPAKELVSIKDYNAFEIRETEVSYFEADINSLIPLLGTLKVGIPRAAIPPAQDGPIHEYPAMDFKNMAAEKESSMCTIL